MPDDERSDYNALFESLRAKRAWGFLTFQLKDGAVVLIDYNRKFRTIREATAAFKAGGEQPPPPD
jgi:hypothetical protein